MAEMDDDELLDALGVEVEAPETGRYTPREERMIAGFEDILRFYQAHGRVPQHGEGNDIFERLYAVRLDRLRQLPEAQVLLKSLDAPGLLNYALVATDVDVLDEDALLAALGVNAVPSDDDITKLRHVRSYIEKKAAEEIANRQPCKDFDRFKPLFDEAEAGLKAKTWITKPFVKDATIQVGDFYILGGQIAFVAEMHEAATTKDGRENPRLRVVFNNQTESDLLLRSLSRSLYPDGDTPVGQRLIKKDIDAGPLFSQEWEEGDIQSGTIYVLRSLSDHPFIVKHRELIHKIGVTGGKVETRIADAKNDATYLLAEVEVVAEYKLAGIARTKLEGIFHRVFGKAQLDLTLLDRFGKEVHPREWFLVPLPVINEVVERILDGTITDMVYEPAQARLVSVA